MFSWFYVEELWYTHKKITKCFWLENAFPGGEMGTFIGCCSEFKIFTETSIRYVSVKFWVYRNGRSFWINSNGNRRRWYMLWIPLYNSSDIVILPRVLKNEWQKQNCLSAWDRGSSRTDDPNLSHKYKPTSATILYFISLVLGNRAQTEGGKASTRMHIWHTNPLMYPGILREGEGGEIPLGREGERSDSPRSTVLSETRNRPII